MGQSEQTWEDESQGGGVTTKIDDLRFASRTAADLCHRPFAGHMELNPAPLLSR